MSMHLRRFKGHRSTIAAAAIVLGLAFGASSGASAQCAGSYHASSGGGAHSATQGTGSHSAASAVHAASTPSCASAGGARTANVAHPFPHAAGFGAARPAAAPRHANSAPGGSVGAHKATSDKPRRS